jgi:uncharacterized glyoxalase superfamily protein PhnB
LPNVRECVCCGHEKKLQMLRGRDGFGLCRDCLGWLADQVAVSTTPILPVTDIDAAVDFYERAGFDVRRYIDETGQPSGHAFVTRDDRSVFDLGEEKSMDPATNRAACYLITQDADDWHAYMRDAGLPVTDIADQPWGMREYALADPFGNHVRVGRSI